MKLSKNLSRSEIACKCGCGFDTMDIKTVEVFQALRNHIGKPIKINSGCRCPKRNEEEGGRPKTDVSRGSQHLYGRAMDCKMSSADVEKGWKFLNEQYEGRYGFGKYKTFIHIDTRTEGPARWDNG